MTSNEFKKLTIQDIFDRIVERSKIPVESRDHKGYCFYRDPEGKKPPCFIGVLIKDEFYNPKMEGAGVKFRTAVEKSIGRATTKTEEQLLIRCQAVHDTHGPSKWEERLKVIAQAYNLEYK